MVEIETVRPTRARIAPTRAPLANVNTWQLLECAACRRRRRRIRVFYSCPIKAQPGTWFRRGAGFERLGAGNGPPLRNLGDCGRQLLRRGNPALPGGAWRYPAIAFSFFVSGSSLAARSLPAAGFVLSAPRRPGSGKRISARAATAPTSGSLISCIRSAFLRILCEPGYSWKLDAPFVWGPLGGTQNYSLAMILTRARCAGSSGQEGLCTVWQRIAIPLPVRPRAQGKRFGGTSAADDGQFNRASATLPAYTGATPLLLLETGVRLLAAGRQRDPNRREVRILWSGQFEPRKCLPLLLRALAELPASVDYRVRILGRGAEERRWRRLARRLHVERRIEWLGWLPLQEGFAQYQWADLFVFTSLRDTAGTVAVEASLAAGLPVIWSRSSGGSTISSAKIGGVKIAVTTPREVIFNGWR